MLVLSVVAGLLYLNGRETERAARLDEATHHAMEMMTALRQTRYGVSRMVSSMNEMLVLRLVNQSELASEIAHEQQLYDSGRQLVEHNLATLVTGGVKHAGAGIQYQTLAAVRQHHQTLIGLAAAIQGGGLEHLKPAEALELKERLEQQEMEQLALLATMIDDWQTRLTDLDNAGQASIHNMTHQTRSLAVFLVLGLAVFLAFIYRLLFREQSARIHLAQLMLEKDIESEHRLRLEQALAHARKLESLGTFAGGIAHELNNQLLPVMTMAESLHQHMDQDNPERRKLGIILSGVGNAKHTVERLLGFVRNESRNQGSSTLADCWRETAELLRVLCPGHVRLRLEAGELHGDIRLDINEFQDILINLFNNAVHALGGTPGQIRISAQMCVMGPGDPSLLPPGKYAVLSVQDSGHGMDQQTLERIFDPFFTTKLPGEGVGLGLSTVHGAITGAGGKISVSSDPGEGTTFTLLLPLTVPQE